MSRTRTHPGEYRLTEYLGPLNLSAGQLADALGLPRSCFDDIVRERRSVDADTALRPGRDFGTTAQIWTNMQTTHDRAEATDPSRNTPRPAS